jgi:predicted ABC-type ATPase
MRKTFLAIGIYCLVICLEAHVFYSPEMLEEKLNHYTAQERKAIHKDLQIVKSICFPEETVSQKHPTYVATAGAPGARKTTILEKFIKTDDRYKNCVHLDPDSRGLKFMVHTYISQSLSPTVIAEVHDYNQVIKNAYEHWVLASTYICSELLEEALENHYDIAHGTTLTGDVAEGLLKAIQEEGYEITLLLCGCSSEFRAEAIRYRNQEQRFYQSSPEDTLQRAKLFPQKMEIYFKYANHLHFFWSDTLSTLESLAASYENGILTIHEEDTWKSFVEKYEEDRMILIREGKQIASLRDLLNRRR